MPSPGIAPRGVSFAHRDRDPPSPAKKYAPRWFRYNRVSCHLLEGLGKWLGNVIIKLAV
jgi:hypothetical protein